MKFGPFTNLKELLYSIGFIVKGVQIIALTRRFSADVHFSTWVACLDGSLIIIDGRVHCAGVGNEGGGVGDEGAGGVGDGGDKICLKYCFVCYGGPHNQTYTKNKYNVLIGQNNISNLITLSLNSVSAYLFWPFYAFPLVFPQFLLPNTH